MYLYVRQPFWEKLIKKTQTSPAAGRQASTFKAAWVGRGEQGEALPAISVPRGGLHLDLGRLRLKTLSNLTSRLMKAATCRVGRGQQGEALQQSAHREVDLISIKGVYGSKPGLIWPLDCWDMGNIILYG